ncbi:MAG: Yip1 family protein [Qingshengfaniella sp.]
MNAYHLLLSPRWIVAETLATLRRPREVAARMLTMGLPVPILWEALILVVTLSVLIGQGAVLMTGGHMPGEMAILTSPLLLAIFQILLLGVTVFLVYALGRILGGEGSFADTLTLLTWLQVVMVCLQLAQAVAFFLLPSLAVLLGYVGIVLFLWLLTNFVAVLHGFRSTVLVFLMILVLAFGIAFFVSLLIAMLGFNPSGAFNV